MATALKYKRLLVKLSGEQLAGERGGGVDAGLIAWIAKELKQTAETGAQIVLTVGGGNFMRGAKGSGGGLGRVTADFMGMLGGVMNAIAVADIFNANDLAAYALSPIKVEQVIDYYTQRRALHHLNKGRIVVIGGGTARPYFTHDTSAVSLALELGCDVVCKTTKVDGVYDKDPVKFPDAVKFEHMSFQQAVEDDAIKVMDKAALGLAMEEHLPIIVCRLEAEGNIRRVALGEAVGTLIS